MYYAFDLEIELIRRKMYDIRSSFWGFVTKYVTLTLF